MLGVILRKTLKALLWSKRPLLVIPSLVLIGASVGLIYWYRFTIEAAYVSLLEKVIATAGLSVIPLALWSIALVLAVKWRRGWLRRINIWAGLLLLIVAATGILSFYEPTTGPVAVFAMNGEASLGGSFGEIISGSTVGTGIGVLRVIVLVALSVIVAFPKLTGDFVAVILRGLVSLYILLAFTARALARLMTSTYRFQGQSSTDRTQREHGVQSARLPDQEVDADLLESHSDREAANPAVARDMRVTNIKSDHPKNISLPEPDEVEDVSESDSQIGARGNGWSDSNHGVTEFPSEEGFPNDKSNRFWKVAEEENEEVDSITEIEISDVRDESKGQVHVADGPWEMPTQNILIDAVEGDISETEMADTAETIRRTLVEYGVEVESGEIKPGPAVTMYGLIPGWVRRYKQTKALDEKGVPKLDESGKVNMERVETKTRVKVDSILSREKDLALALRTPSIRIETPVMGKSMVGIEVPNPEPALVTLGNVMHGKEFKKLREIANLPIALGKGSGGETVMMDLAKMPHLLVAGATGSGKSVFINTIVSCLLMEKSPAEMRLFLVDPKRVELTPYNGVPHLLTPVVVETDKVVGFLKSLIQEMFNRYRRMEEVGVRNIDGYNTKMSETMPYVVIAVDELADLMMTAAFDVEQSLCRLAQLGRATGIHLVVATQRPSVDVVTGLIKANFPSRVSFGVTSQIDSRTILDTAGAEKLLGRGDMLYLSQDASRPKRVQGVYISDSEIENLVTFWRTAPKKPLSHIELQVVTSKDADENLGVAEAKDSTDELIDKALEVAQHHNKLSTSLLQRRLRIGYPRAARLMDQLEERGVVGPSDGSKSREVIINQM